jgi:hypothetical protein
MKRMILAVLTSFVIASPVYAAPLSAPEFSTFVQSLLSNSDYAMLGLLTGFPPSATLHYSSRADATGWRGDLTGTINGTPVQITYTGVISQFAPSEGTLTYTSSGTFGSVTLMNGRGDVSWDLLPVSGFVVLDYRYHRDIGGTRSGSADDNEIESISPAELSSQLTFPIEGTYLGNVGLVPAELHSCHVTVKYEATGPAYHSDTAYDPRDVGSPCIGTTLGSVIITANGKLIRTATTVDMVDGIIGLVGVVPEPSPTFLLAIALAGLLGVGWWRRRYRRSRFFVAIPRVVRE